MRSNSTWRDRRNLLVDMIAFMIVSPIVGLSTVLALQLAESLFILDSFDKVEQQVQMEADQPPKVHSPVNGFHLNLIVLSVIIKC